jgi:hydrogenase/urease accessory protein HupE
MLHHSWYSFVAINLLQTKYFFGFLLMQLPVHASGISFKPSENDQFEGIKTINIYGFLTAFHLRDKVNNWNMAVQ